MSYERIMLGESWPESDADRQLRAIVREYDERAEAYDRSVCTGPIINGEIMPANGSEFSAINRHALALRKELEPRVLAIGKTIRDFQQELIGFRKIK